MRRERVATGWLVTGTGIALLLVTMAAVAHAPVRSTPIARAPVAHAPAAHAPATHPAGVASNAVRAVTGSSVQHPALVRTGEPATQRVVSSRTAAGHRAPRDAVLGGPSRVDARRLVRR
jgi:hypothetical protein